MLAGEGFCVIGHTVSVSFYDTKKRRQRHTVSEQFIGSAGFFKLFSGLYFLISC